MLLANQNYKRLVQFFFILLAFLSFYIPLIVEFDTIVFDSKGIVSNHFAMAQGDLRKEGRFIPFFSIGGNYRPWSDDTVFNPLHLLRLLNIIGGGNIYSWQMIMVLIHILNFWVVYFYSQKLFNVHPNAAFFGGILSLFTINWGLNSQLVNGITFLPFIFIAVCEYYLFFKTNKNKHLIFCIIALSLFPYIGFLGGIFSSFLTFLFCIGIFHLCSNKSRYAFKPLVLIGFSIFFSWSIICGPTIFDLITGRILRFLPGSDTSWNISWMHLPSVISLILPLWDNVVNRLFWIFDPNILINNFYWGTIFFVPSLLILRKTKTKEEYTIYKLILYYICTLILTRIVIVPGNYFGHIKNMGDGILSLLAGLAFSLAFSKIINNDTQILEIKFINRCYRIILCLTVPFIPLLFVSVNTVYKLADQYGVTSNYIAVAFIVNTSKFYFISVILCISFYLLVFDKKMIIRMVRNEKYLMKLKYMMVFLSIALPSWAINYGDFGYQKAMGTDSFLKFYYSDSSEQKYIDDKAKNYQYRVGFLCRVPQNKQTKGNFANIRDIYTDYYFGAHHWGSSSNLLRDGIAYAFPFHHFLPSHLMELFLTTNVMRQNGKIVGNLRWFLVNPDSSLLSDHGVRFVVSNIDLHSLYPNYRLAYIGDYVSIFENKEAMPVAYFSGNSDHPLKLYSLIDGFFIPVQRRSGKLIISMDLWNMKITGMSIDGFEIDFMPDRLSETKWSVDIPAGVERLVFRAKDYKGYIVFVILCFLAFLASLVFISRYS